MSQSLDTAAFLLVDGFTNGAVYAQVALCLVLIFTITRVVNIAQGEYVMLGALTLASFVEGEVPGTLYIAAFGLSIWGAAEAWSLRVRPLAAASLALGFAAAAALLVAMTLAVVRLKLGMAAAMAASFVLVSTLGAVVYQLTVRPIATSSTIVLVIVSVGVQMTLQGLGLLLWGSGPHNVPAVATGDVMLGPVAVSYQSLWIVATSALMMIALYAFFEFTILGKALRASAVNRRGAQICGIPVTLAGSMSFFLAAGFSALSGMLVAPLITAHYDMGFNIGLKGFVGSAMGGLVDYPLAIGGVLVVGVLEAFSAYALSAFRDAIVFMLIIPILLWRSSRQPYSAGEDQ